MSRQRGAALVVAVFLIVVLALLATVAVRLTSVQSQNVNLNLLGARALNAARAGIEWSVQRTLSAGTCFSGATTLTEGALTGFNVSVSCSQTSHAEGAATVQVFAITAFASNGSYGQPDYVSRRLSAVVSQTL